MATTLTFVSLLLGATYSQSTQYPGTTDCTYATVDDNYVTYCDLNNTLRAQILEKFANYDTFIDLIAKIVRLEFHDCFGPKEGDQTVAACDGCIDQNLGDHAGIESGAIDRIEGIYTRTDNGGGQNWFLRMSRADYWAAVSTIAIQESNWLDGSVDFRNIPTAQQDQDIPYIPFYIGRLDCSASPWTATTTTKEFPDALQGWGHNFALFQSSFGLTNREYIALMGAHGLGRVHSGNSGFGDEIGKPWTAAWDVVNNEFYNVLLDDSTRTTRDMDWWQQERELGDGKYEWRGDTVTERVRMLNSDMGLLFNIDNKIDATTGACSCTYDTCGQNANRKAILEEYAGDNQLWLNEFAAVFDKMIKTGYDTSTDPSDLDVLAEDWYYTDNGITPPTFISECVSVETYTSDMDSAGAASGAYGPFGKLNDRRIGNALEATLNAWTADANYASCEQSLSFLSYYWGYQYVNKYIEIDVRICCGAEAAVFSDAYSAPSGYVLGTGAPFIDEDGDGEVDEDELTKQIIVFCIIGLLICLCIIGGIVFYKKYKAKKLENETSDAIADKNGDQTNIETVSPSITAVSPSITLH